MPLAIEALDASHDLDLEGESRMLVDLVKPLSTTLKGLISVATVRKTITREECFERTKDALLKRLTSGSSSHLRKRSAERDTSYCLNVPPLFFKLPLHALKLHLDSSHQLLSSLRSVNNFTVLFFAFASRSRITPYCGNVIKDYSSCAKSRTLC